MAWAKIKKGEVFYATVRIGLRSLTLEGKEGAGRRIGPFTASRDNNSLATETENRFFAHRDFKIEKGL